MKMVIVNYNGVLIPHRGIITGLAQNAMKQLEKMIARVTGIEKWAVDILCY